MPNTANALGKNPEPLRQRYGTPRWFIDRIQKHFNVRFTLDACAEKSTAVCDRYFTIADDGLKQSWRTEGLWWCNPPFANVHPWIAKAIQESIDGHPGMLLLPAKPGERWWRYNCMYANCIYVISPQRVNFLSPLTMEAVKGVSFHTALWEFCEGSNSGATVNTCIINYLPWCALKGDK